jgi:hypothetical protein
MSRTLVVLDGTTTTTLRGSAHLVADPATR